MFSELQVNAIVGPTGCGKTATAEALARSLKVPIVVADRIQCFTDIPVTSARAGSIKGLSYNFISERTIVDGDYCAKEAFADLMSRIEELAVYHRLIVIEGGSISLLTELARKEKLPFRLSVDVISMCERGRHWQQLRLRAMEMLTPADKKPGLLKELSQAWRHAQQRSFVASINGFEAVLAWCQRHGVDPAKIGEQHQSERVITEMASEIANAHMDHSLKQQSAMRNLFGESDNHHVFQIRKSSTTSRLTKPGSVSQFLKTDLTLNKRCKPRVTVYCGARPGSLSAYTEAAVQLGQSLATAGIELVYGGGSIGLMGTLADATLACGGTVCGVIPQAMVDYEIAHSGLTTRYVTETMHERKALMAELGDAFIALPGGIGIGTAEELLEIMTWNQLGIHDKPCVLFDVESFFTPFKMLLDHFVTNQFMSSSHYEQVIVCRDPVSVVDTIRNKISQLKFYKIMPLELEV